MVSVAWLVEQYIAVCILEKEDISIATMSNSEQLTQKQS